MASKGGSGPAQSSSSKSKTSGPTGGSSSKSKMLAKTSSGIGGVSGQGLKKEVPKPPEEKTDKLPKELKMEGLDRRQFREIPEDFLIMHQACQPMEMIHKKD